MAVRRLVSGAWSYTVRRVMRRGECLWPLARARGDVAFALLDLNPRLSITRFTLEDRAMHESLRSKHNDRILPGLRALERESELLEGADPREVIAWAVETYGEGLALSASFGGGEGMALLDMISKVTDKVTILTIDTGFIFKETAEFREEVMRRYKLPVEVLKPELTIEEQVERYGEQMRTCTPNLCCQIRKIEPLQKALQGYDAWMTGIRREQTPQRANTRTVAWEERYGAAKIAPLAFMTEEWAHAYVAE